MRSMPVITFQDRRDAGRRLGGRLRHLRGEDMVVLGLPRGGVPVAFEVARALKAPLDLLLVRKLGVPFQRELAMGAVGEGGITVYNEDVLRAAGISPDEVEAARSREMSELSLRADRYRAGQSPVDLTDRVAVIIDDGIATGASMRVAIEVVRVQEPARVVVATPVVSEDAAELLRPLVDDLVALAIPRRFVAVGSWYEDFSEIRDDDVRQLLDSATAAWGSRIPRDADYNPTS
jgi:putative phosphoribosyl transferase